MALRGFYNDNTSLPGRSSSGPKRQADIAAITSKASPVRNTYDTRGIRPSYGEMIGKSMSGMEIAATMASGILSLNSGVPAKADEIAIAFSCSYPDVMQSVSKAGGIAVNSQ